MVDDLKESRDTKDKKTRGCRTFTDTLYDSIISMRGRQALRVSEGTPVLYVIHLDCYGPLPVRGLFLRVSIEVTGKEVFLRELSVPSNGNPFSSHPRVVFYPPVTSGRLLLWSFLSFPVLSPTPVEVYTRRKVFKFPLFLRIHIQGP